MTLHPNFIAGEWTKSAEGAEDENPSDLATPVGVYARGGADDARAAAAAARAAFKGWSGASPQVRAEMLDRVGDLLKAQQDTLGALLASEEGKTLAEAKGEVLRAAQIFKYFAGEAVRLTGDRLDSVRPGVDVEVTREPVGVVGLITPWNFPIAIPAWKAAPALAFGNTVVLKPAEVTPGCAWALARIIAEAGAPAGVFNLVMGRGSVVGAALVECAEVEAISFTGSVPTGRSLAERCARHGKRIQAEMGGKNPLVVVDDADLDDAVAVALNGAFFSTGQRCTASARLIVTRGIHDRFVERLTTAMRALRIGHALDAETQIGPVVSEGQLQTDLDYIGIAKQEGCEVIGGGRVEARTPGHYLAPALLVGSDNAMRVNREEIFGPVASVIRAADLDEAIAIANDTPFGLSAGICTTSLAAARRFKREAEAGMVMVNLPTAGVDFHAPFGGRKQSSIGPREQGAYARDFYTIVKTAYTG